MKLEHFPLKNAGTVVFECTACSSGCLQVQDTPLSGMSVIFWTSNQFTSVNSCAQQNLCKCFPSAKICLDTQISFPTEIYEHAWTYMLAVVGFEAAKLFRQMALFA